MYMWVVGTFKKEKNQKEKKLKKQMKKDEKKKRRNKLNVKRSLNLVFLL